jgi:type VI secretion system protein ImpK
MQILNVAGTLLASVMMTSLKDASFDRGVAYGSFVLDEYEKCMHNLNFLPFPEDVVSEAKYILTVFVDEKMMTGSERWELLQMKYYQSNCGGEEFFTRLDSLMQRFSVMDSGSPELLELYNYLLSLGFRGVHWHDTAGVIRALRKKINQILQLPAVPVLSNQTDEHIENKPMRHFDRKSFISILIMLLVFIALLLCLNDFLTEHSRIWDGIYDDLDYGSKVQLKEVLKR